MVAGDLLVAAPQLSDPNFRRAVVLLLNHDEDGALGVVLNRPLEAGVDAVLPDWHDVVSQPASLFQGGPVGLDSALALATMLPGADRYPGVTRVAGPFGVVDLDADPEEGSRVITGMRVFAGYAGWGPGSSRRRSPRATGTSWTPTRPTSSRRPRTPCGAACCDVRAARWRSSRRSRRTRA